MKGKTFISSSRKNNFITSNKSENKGTLNAFLIVVAFVATIFCVVMGAFLQTGFDVQIGAVSDYRIIAERKIENRIATEKNRNDAIAAAENIRPLTKRDPSINDKVYEKITSFFGEVTEFRKEKAPIFNPNETTNNEGAGTENTDQLLPTDTPQPVDLGISLSSSLTEVLLTMDTPVYNNLMEQTFVATEILLENGIIERETNVKEVDSKSLLSIKEEVDKLDLNSSSREICYQIISEFIEPNIVVDTEKTEAAREQRASEYEIVYYLKGEMIIDKNQIITEEAYHAILDLGLVKGSYREIIIPVVGFSVIVGLIFFSAVLYIKEFYKTVSSTRREVLLIFTLYMAAIFMCFALINVSYYYIPIIVVTMLIAVLVDERLAIMLNVFITIICAFIYRGETEFILFFLLSGTCISLIAKYTTERNKIMVVGFLASLINFVVIIGISFVFSRTYTTETFYTGVFAAATGIISVILAIGSLPIWEAVFGIVTPIKLLDLANPNNPLLRRLTIEAPGTYHHCLIVANLAETAAYDIDANPSLARVGAYYHDIGKLKYPTYFFENKVGKNLHDDMNPYESVQVITSHVAYGLELADTYRLPRDVKDIVGQHHGTTLMKYFYYKAKSLNPEIEVEQNDFRYKFETPKSKESAIVMLADTVEAAVRSMLPSVKSIDEVETFVRELVNDKVSDGQLNDSSLTLRDIETIIKSFMRVFKGMYHERIAYPKAPAKGEDTQDTNNSETEEKGSDVSESEEKASE